ncbi:MAG: hypothetical protein WBE26_19035 [Phycisphaerae bacterium]
MEEWLQFLHSSHSAAGFPLVVGGAGLMLFGWRMWKICVILSFGLIGAVITSSLVGPCNDQWLYTVAGGVALGLLSYWPASHAVAVLGGLIGGGIVTHFLAGIGLSGTALWAAGGAAFIACTAFAFLNRQHVVIVVTAFLGAMLLVSGLAAWLMAMPGLYGTVRGMATGSAIVVPFLLLVPMVMSCFYQGAEVRRLNMDM